MENESSLASPEHYDCWTFVLSFFNKSMEKFVVLVEDNGNTNWAFYGLVGPIFIHCYSHRFNLAVKDLIYEHSDLKSQKVYAKPVILNICCHAPSINAPVCKESKRTKTELKISEAKTLYLDFKSSRWACCRQNPWVDLNANELYDVKALCMKLAELDTVTIAL